MLKIDPAFIPLTLVLALLFFMFVREVLTWYWKINRIEELLENIEKNTRGEESVSREATEPKEKDAGKV